MGSEMCIRDRTFSRPRHASMGLGSHLVFARLYRVNVAIHQGSSIVQRTYAEYGRREGEEGGTRVAVNSQLSAITIPCCIHFVLLSLVETNRITLFCIDNFLKPRTEIIKLTTVKNPSHNSSTNNGLCDTRARWHYSPICEMAPLMDG